VANAGRAAKGAAAAQESGTQGWRSVTDSARGVAFKYPADLGTSYIHAVDWPPMLQIVEGPFTCTEAGSESARAGKTERRTIGGRSYCVTRETEGAAGSIYTLYAFAFPDNGKVFILTFSLRSVQCANYDDPRKQECNREREGFDIGPVADRIAQSIETTK
jgi:hypothetical protein